MSYSIKLDDVFKEVISILDIFTPLIGVMAVLYLATYLLKSMAKIFAVSPPYVSTNRYLLRFDCYAETITRLCPRQDKKDLAQKILLWRKQLEGLLEFIDENNLLDRRAEAQLRLESIQEKIKKTPKFVLFGRRTGYSILKEERNRISNELLGDLYRPITQLNEILLAMDDLSDQLMIIASSKQAHKQNRLLETINEHTLKFNDYLAAWREVKVTHDDSAY